MIGEFIRELVVRLSTDCGYVLDDRLGNNLVGRLWLLDCRYNWILGFMTSLIFLSLLVAPLVTASSLSFSGVDHNDVLI